MIDKGNVYTQMQAAVYNDQANNWSVQNRDPVVGSFDGHNAHKDYDLLFIDMDDLKSKKVLDFACGPGRNIVKFHDRFLQIDGADISSNLLGKAREWLTHNNIDPNTVTLYNTDGVSLEPIEPESYDIIMSTIAMQHICVHEIRYNILSDMLRVLNPNGWITIQMGYGMRLNSVDYYANEYAATGTNGNRDVSITNPEQLEGDLVKIGFRNFSYTITSVGPGDAHDNWIFFRGQK